MNNYKYIGILALIMSFIACDDDVYPPIEASTNLVTLDVNNLDLSKYISVGASFTAGFTDAALFIEGQKNSFPNILSSKFAMANGGNFSQPLMNDNIGGFLFNGQINLGGPFLPRLYFDGEAPASLLSLRKFPTTEATTNIATDGPYHNIGIPGIKSFHLPINGYGALNPYFGRIATTTTQSVLGYIQENHADATFFTLSEIGGNDVLDYAISGGESNSGAANFSPITPAVVFDASFDIIIANLTENGAKGVVGNVPYITSLPHFTTVPYNPLDPLMNTDLASQIPLLNNIYGAVNQIYTAVGEPERAIVFSETETNPVVVYDEDLTDLTTIISSALQASPTFVPFVQSLGLPAATAPLVAQLLGQQYGKARTAYDTDLLVLPSSSIIGEVNKDHTADLILTSGGLLPAILAGQFSAEGITLPLEDKWVLTAAEQAEIKTATDAYNTKIVTVVNANENLALVDLNAILEEATTTGLMFDSYMLTTNLVTGGLISLDGVHLTSRGYALMANKILEAMDNKFGSNFSKATNGLAKADNYPTNYSPTLE